MANPIAVSTFRSTIKRIASTIATPAMIVYCRVRYAFAPSCTAPEISCMRSLPGDFASRRRVITAP
jgi:hypothetical protein